MTTKVKNTFIDVDESPENRPERHKRRNKTEPAAPGFMNCADAGDDDDEDSDADQPGRSQPGGLEYTKTYDPFETGKSPSVVSKGSPVQGEKAASPGGKAADDNRNRTVVKNTFIEVEEEDAAKQQRQAHKRSATLPSKSRKVAFVCGGEEDSEDDDDDDDDGAQPTGITYDKTYDNFEQSAGTPNVVSHQGSVVSHQGSMSQGSQQNTGVPVAMGVMQQPQVFTIPIPVGMQVGTTHAIQLPMGLPPGSTIVVMPTNMGSAAMGPAGPVAGAALTLPAAITQPGAAIASSSSPGSPVTAPQLPNIISKVTKLDGSLRIMYFVDARKLKANDKVVISPPFEISAEHPGTYRLIINPSPIKARGGPTFKNTGGLGNVQLKCEDRTEGSIGFRIFITDGRPNSIRSELSRGPVDHDFANGGVCGLPHKTQEWDFNKVVDGPSKTFAVCLDLAK